MSDGGVVAESYASLDQRGETERGTGVKDIGIDSDAGEDIKYDDEEPHPIFVDVLGDEELTPTGLLKSYCCARFCMMFWALVFLIIS